MRSAAIAIACVIATAGLALADKPASLAHYNKAKQAYTSANFTAAIDELELAYREFPAPEYLHDIAQAMKRLDRCGEAVMYFERFLVEKPAASNRAAIETQIAALRQRCPQTAPPPAAKPAASSVPPSAPADTRGTVAAPVAPNPRLATANTAASNPRVATDPNPRSAPDPLAPNPRLATANTTAASPRGATDPVASNPRVAANTVAPDPRVATELVEANPRVATADSTAAATTVAVVQPDARSPWSGSATAGVTFLGAGPVEMPPVGELDLMARYRVMPRLRVGAGLDVARVPYADVSSGTAWLAGPQLSVETDVPVRDRLAVVAGAAIGARAMWGLGMGNPFVDGGRASGAITMFLVRAEAGVTWTIDPRFTLRALPLVLEYSPRRAPLASDIGSLRGLGMSIGVDVNL